MGDLKFGISSADMARLSAAIVERGGSFSFQAHGSSMFPFVRDGDILTVQPIDPAQLNVGDVVLYQSTPERLTAHRIVGVRSTGNGILLLARGDASTGAAEAVRPDQVLGRVVNLRRKGRTISLDGRRQKKLARLWVGTAPLGPCLLHLARRGQQAALWTLLHLQSLSAYRRLAHAIIGPQLHLRPATAADAPRLARLYHQARFPELDDPASEIAAWVQDRPNFAGDVLLATSGGRLAGAVVLCPDDEGTNPAEGWQILGLLVRTRYRGAGVGERLVRQAIAQAAARDLARIHLLVCPQNRPALALFEKVGFRPDSIPDRDRQPQAEPAAAGHEPMVMTLSTGRRPPDGSTLPAYTGEDKAP